MCNIVVLSLMCVLLWPMWNNLHVEITRVISEPDCHFVVVVVVR